LRLQRALEAVRPSRSFKVRASSLQSIEPYKKALKLVKISRLSRLLELV